MNLHKQKNEETKKKLKKKQKKKKIKVALRLVFHAWSKETFPAIRPTAAQGKKRESAAFSSSSSRNMKKIAANKKIFHRNDRFWCSSKCADRCRSTSRPAAVECLRAVRTTKTNFGTQFLPNGINQVKQVKLQQK